MRHSFDMFRRILPVMLYLATAVDPGHAQTVRGAERVEFDSLDRGDRPVRLFGWFFPAQEKGLGKAATVVALHGCGGLYDRGKELNPHHRAVAELLQQQG